MLKLNSESDPSNEHGMQAYFLITRSSSDFRLKFIIRCLLSVEGTKDVMGRLTDRSTAIPMKTGTPSLAVPPMWWEDLAYSVPPATIPRPHSVRLPGELCSALPADHAVLPLTPGSADHDHEASGQWLTFWKLPLPSDDVGMKVALRILKVTWN